MTIDPHNLAELFSRLDPGQGLWSACMTATDFEEIRLELETAGGDFLAIASDPEGTGAIVFVVSTVEPRSQRARDAQGMVSFTWQLEFICQEWLKTRPGANVETSEGWTEILIHEPEPKEQHVPSFKDTSGRQWQLAISHADAVKVKKDHSIDLYKLLDDKLAGLAALGEDPGKFVAVCWDLIDKKAEPAITFEQFGRTIDGATLEGMRDAFYAALQIFFPGKATRDNFAKIVAKAKALEESASRLVAEKLDAMSPEQILADLLKKPDGEAAAK